MPVILLLEVLFVLVGVGGLALIYLPAGLIVAGLLGALWCERADAQRKRRAETGKRGERS